MRVSIRLRTATGLTGGALGLLGLIATPASACLPADSGATPDRAGVLARAVPAAGLTEAATAKVAPHARLQHRVTTAAHPRAVGVDRLDVALDRIAGRLAADRAQWAGVTTLTTSTVRSAKHDLAATRLARVILTSLDRKDAGTAAQEARVDALKPAAAALARQLRALVASYAAQRGLSVKHHRDGDRNGAFHRCDGHGDRDGFRAHHRDGSRR